MTSGVQREPLVDTDVWIDSLRGNPQAIKCVKLLPERVWISAVSVAELHAGVREGTEREALAQLLSTLEVVDLNGAIATRGGLLRRESGGNPSFTERIGIFVAMKMVPKKIELHASATYSVAACARIYCATGRFNA